MNQNIQEELFGRDELSDDYLTLLKSYGMKKEDGIIIRDETVKFVSSLMQYEKLKDYEIIMVTIDEFRIRFSGKFEELHGHEINWEKLNLYKPNMLYWQIKNDQKKTEEI